MATLRRMVSKKKKRYCENGFDLDLTYINDRVISMGFPSSGVESVYRNPMKDVQKFLETYHKGHYKVYNLCAEPDRCYPPESFHGRVERYFIYDHMAPPLEFIEPFCKSCKEWLDKHDDNIVVVHCKAGKGRAGTMVCMLLLYMGYFSTAEDVMKYYGEKRTYDGKGVTIPSQKRYIRYWEHILKHGPRPRTEVTLKRLRLRVFHMLDKSDVWCLIKTKNDRLSSKTCAKVHINWPESILDINFSGLTLEGDVMVIVYNKKIRLFHFWFNTAYVDGGRAVIPLKHLDRVFKKAKFNKRLAVELQFEGANIPFLNNSAPSSKALSTNGNGTSSPSGHQENGATPAGDSLAVSGAAPAVENPTSSYVQPGMLTTSISGRTMSESDEDIDLDDPEHGYSVHGDD